MAPVQSFVSITPTWHNSPYPKISPTRPELSAKGKSLLITGGGTGIGLAVARGFATAGVREIALTGRRIGVLNKAAEALKKDFAGVRVLALVMDVTVKESVDRAFEEAIKAFGRVDICVSNAGYSPPPTPIATIDPQDWLQGFDTNVKGSLYVIQAFLKDAKVGSFLLNTSSGIGHMPALAGLSSYSSSKAAGIKMFESVAAENPGINVFNVQPGMIITDVHRVGNAGNELDVDDVDLPGHFYVWLVSPEASFLRSKFVWANWDVDELVGLKDKILNKGLIDIDMRGLDWSGWTPARMLEAARNM